MERFKLICLYFPVVRYQKTNSQTNTTKLQK